MSATARVDAALSGADIYQRVLDNRFDSFVQETQLSSGDRSGNIQTTRFKMWYQSYHRPADELPDGTVLSRTLVKYTAPFEMRRSGYLVIHNYNRLNDQFIYRPSSGVIRRVNLRGESVFGSDFSLEDIIPKELDYATYERLADSIEQGRGAFVIIAKPKPDSASEYSKVQIYVDKERSVPLRSRYWDDRGAEFKELVIPTQRVERQNEVWVPMEMSIRNNRTETYSKLEIERIEPNAVIPRSELEIRKLLHD